jgi:uncharacterized DUF497 family protein
MRARDRFAHCEVRYRSHGGGLKPAGKPLTYQAGGLNSFLVKVAWDPAKNLANQRKHGISFEEASELFRTRSDYLEIFDDEHSVVEDRFIAVGPIRRGLVVIIWTERDEETIRIMSARWATKREHVLYHSYLDEKQ